MDLRAGALARPARLLALAKQTVDPHASTPGQVLLDRFVRDGHYARHVK
jgi:DNA-binding transcriptional MocR family regulator